MNRQGDDTLMYLLQLKDRGDDCTTADEIIGEGETVQKLTHGTREMSEGRF